MLYEVITSAVNAAIAAVDSPARAAMLPGLVGRRRLASALALHQTQTNVAKAAIPALGGLLIATVGYPVTYGVITSYSIHYTKLYD